MKLFSTAEKPRPGNVHWTFPFESQQRPDKSKTPTCHRHMSVSLWLGMRDNYRTLIGVEEVKTVVNKYDEEVVAAHKPETD